MHTDATLAGLGNAKLQRIVARIFALRAGEKPAPRLQARTVKRVALRTHLEKNIRKTQRFGRIEQTNQFGFLLRGR